LMLPSPSGLILYPSAFILSTPAVSGLWERIKEKG